MRSGLFQLMAKGMGALTPVRPNVWGSREPFAGAWQRGIQVESIGGIAAFSAVYACVTTIAGDVAKLRIKVMRQDASTAISTEVRSGMAAVNVLRRPNRYQTRLQFITAWMVSKLMFGNTYVLKVRNSRGEVVALHVLDPRRVRPLVTEQGDVYYSIGRGQEQLAPTDPGEHILPASELMHDRCAALWHPLVGISPISACGISATMGLKIQANSLSFFENLSRPGGMLTAPHTIDDVTADRLKREFGSGYSGANLGKLAVLGDGLKFDAIPAMPAHDAQLVEQLGWATADVCRAFAFPAHRLGAGQAPSLNNVEALEQAYYTACLQIHIEGIELCLDAGLELPQNMATEFDLDGLLRMDGAARYEAISAAVGGGWMAPNEGRARENLPPVEGGASPMAQQQNYSLAALAKRDATEDPFAGSPTRARERAARVRRQIDLDSAGDDREPAQLRPMDDETEQAFTSFRKSIDRIADPTRRQKAMELYAQLRVADIASRRINP